MFSFKLLIKLTIHFAIAFVLYFNQITIPIVFGASTGNPNALNEISDGVRSKDQLKDISNAKTNADIDASGDIIKPPACSDTDGIKKYMEAQKVQFNDSYYRQFNQAQLSLRAQMNADTRALYGTFAFVGPHAGNFGGSPGRPANQIQSDLKATQEKMDKKILALNQAKQKLAE